MAVVRHKEAIHSGHFMISEFEAEAAEPAEGTLVEEEGGTTSELKVSFSNRAESFVDISLKQLFQRMSIAYRQKLTSPKWNHFRGLKLRWKDKIRLNNVIWRCWHMQFIKGKSKLLCAFANPLEIIDHHNMMEGGTLLEGKYWKRKLRTITNEYKRWRLFHYHFRGALSPSSLLGDPDRQASYQGTQQGKNSEGHHNSNSDDVELDQLLVDSDLFVDALFDSLEEANHSFAVPFPNPRDVYKSTTNADFIQPGLIQLQPNLEEINIGDLEWLNPSPSPSYGATSNSCQTFSSRGGLKREIQESNTPCQTKSLNGPTTASCSFSAYDNHFSASSVPAFPEGSSQSSIPLQSHRNSVRQSPKHRILYRDSVRIERQHDIGENYSFSPRSSALPYPKPRNWNNNHASPVIPHPLPTTPENGSELLQLLINKPSSLIKPLRLKIPPPPPHSAPQPEENFEEKSLKNDERRRNIHIHAEHKRRCSIKNGFEIMRSLIPSLNGNSNLKISKAALLHKGGDYLQKLKTERNQLEVEIVELRAKITRLNGDIASFQNALPTVRSSGPECKDQLKIMFQDHVRNCTQQNWKYWIFSLLMKPLFESFETSVGSGTFEDLFRTSLSWLDQHCSMRHIRTSTLKSLTALSTSTEILSRPESLPKTSLISVFEEQFEKNVKVKDE